MDVPHRAFSRRLILLAAGMQLLMGAQALADPVYTAIDLGTGNPTLGTGSGGIGTVTGSNGLTYMFNPVQSFLPAQWQNTTQGVPAGPAPVWSPFTYGDPNYAYSYSNLAVMNSQGLAVGINHSGVDGQLENSEAFLTQLQPNGTWGTPTPLWSGTTAYAVGQSFLGIYGITPNGQVLGTGVPTPGGGTNYDEVLLLYDAKTQTLTNLTSLIDSMKWSNTPMLPDGLSPTWLVNGLVARLDNDGRILVQAYQLGGDESEPHNVLLLPLGLDVDPLVVPEPATWVIFATLIGGGMLHQRRHFERLHPRR